MKFDIEMKKYFSIMALFFSININAQSLQQVYHFGSSDADGIRAIAVDRSGNLYTSVDFWYTNLFLNGSFFESYFSLNGGTDVSFAKFNSQGSLTWKIRVGGDGFDYIYGIQTDANNNVYIAGQTQSSELQFDNNVSPGPPTQFYMQGNQDIFVAKYDSNGVFQWVLPISNPADEYIYDFKVDSSGNSYIAGSLNDFTNYGNWWNYDTLSGSKDIFLGKFDTNGDVIYVKKIDSYSTTTNTLNNRVNSLDVDNAGNLYILGRYRDSTDFDPSPANFVLPNPLPNENTFVAKYDPSGDLAWAYRFECNSSFPTYVHDISVDNTLNAFYITGRLIVPNMNDFDLSTGVAYPNPGAGNMFLAQYDLNAGLNWVESFAASGGGGVGMNDDFMSLKAAPGTGVYVGGNFVFTSDFNPLSSQTNSLTCNGSNPDYYVAKYSTAGLFQWVSGSGSTDDDYTTCLALHANSGTLYVGGVFQQTIDFNPPSSPFTYTSLGLKDAFVLKFSDTTLTSIKNESSFNDDNMFSVFPNPTSSDVRIASNTNHPVISKVTFKLISIEGRTVFTRSLDKNNSIINLEDLNSGIYMYEIKTNNIVTKGKLIKQ